jgi:hypothetical protein
MRIILGLVMLVLTVSSVFAYSDVGLINAPRTLAYYFMPTVGSPNYSSGLVYNQKLTTTEDLEILYTAFNSPFLLTSNITQLGVHKKWKWKFGPLGLNARAGVGGMYSPAVGGGLTGDVGGDIYLKPIDSFAVAVPLFIYLFSDGTRMEVTPSFYFKFPNLDNYEIFGGYRFIASMLRNNASSGTTNSYIVAGLRGGLQ